METDARCYGVYRRTQDGQWLYPWGEPVPGATDLTVGDVLRLGLAEGSNGVAVEDLPDHLHTDALVDHDVESLAAAGDPADFADRVIGMSAPELHVRAMVTISDIAEMVDVAPDTIAAYRYRGYLPEPQAVIGRTPVWSRPVIQHWLQTRPGNGWRTDIYGDRAEHDERVRHLRAARRQQRQRSPA